eukprot:scpid38042/ scgid23617/ Beta-glucuronidase; Beta-D-glucuronoside glucuronosohydrolase
MWFVKAKTGTALQLIAALLLVCDAVAAFSPNRMSKERNVQVQVNLNTQICHTYPCWPTSRVESLSGFWDFNFTTNVADPKHVDLNKVIYNDKMAVPGSFDASPQYAGVRGTAFYRRTVFVSGGNGWRLKFEACSLWCAVYVDGKMIAEHSNGYSPFWVGSTPRESGNHEIVVVVDNRFDKDRTILQSEGYDFYQFGGIIRHLTLHEESSSVAIQGVDVMTKQGGGIVSARVRFHGSQSLPSEVTLTYIVDGNASSSRSSSYPVTDGQATITGIRVDNPRLWSPEAPSLHTLYVSMVGTLGNEQIQDAIIVRFGLRSVEACKRSTGEATLCINGEETKLKGFSRHDAHPQYGASLNRQQWMQDLQILKNMGGNYLRLVHYPHDPEFLSLCDEMGILVWQENLGWGNSESDLTNPDFVKALLQGVDEMVNNTFNHPSIIIWAFLNEGASNKKSACDSAYVPQASRYRELGVNGLVSWASNKKQSDVCLDNADVVSFNSYPGWYGDSGDYSLQDQLGTVAPAILEEASWAAVNQKKPFIKSEIGAGAIPEWEDTFNGFWTAKYQSSLLSIVAETVVSNKNFTGVSLWQFFDVRTCNGPHALGRPRALNNKGILDEYRRPKHPSVDAVRAIFKGEVKHSQCTP